MKNLQINGSCIPMFLLAHPLHLRFVKNFNQFLESHLMTSKTTTGSFFIECDYYIKSVFKMY